MRALLVAFLLVLTTAVPAFANGDGSGYAPESTTIQASDATTLLP